nr:antA/AntB antirepressor family protein [Sedimentibacter sp.]
MDELMNYTKQTPIEIALGIDEEGRTTARKLYGFLELDKSNYSKWCKRNILENEFAEEGIDFYSYQKTNEGRGNFAEDYKLTSAFAKKLSMTAKNKKGEQARDYFIKVESMAKKVASNVSELSPQLQLLISMELKQKQQDALIEDTRNQMFEAKKEVQDIRNAIIINPKAEWRATTNKILNNIGNRLGDYQAPRTEAYEALKVRGACRPNILVDNLKSRALKNGMSQSKIDKLCLLDVLENEPRLREIYISIVKEMAVRSGQNINTQQRMVN